jgi:hypothetical protein
MSVDFHFHLPSWPPQRLLSEAVLSWNLRHMDDALLDPQASPWPVLRGAVLAFLRHNLSAYDEHLRTRCEHDPKFRDELAAQVAAAAYRKYPWLGKDDPRPFLEPEDDSPSQLFTEIARDLAHDHGVRDQLYSAIRDLKRQGKLAQVAALKTTLTQIEKRIERSYKTLTGPKYSHDTHGSQSRGWSFPHLSEEMSRYYFLDDRVVTPNRYDYQGFRCPECNAPVVRLKQPVNFGQGWRMIVYSCFCHTLAIACPPAGRRLKPLTIEGWDFSGENNVSSSP